MTRVFPYAVAALELGAAVVYAYNKQGALALAWFCYAIAAAAFASVS